METNKYTFETAERMWQKNMKGISCKSIGEKCGLSKYTVSSHISRYLKERNGISVQRMEAGEKVV